MNNRIEPDLESLRQDKREMFDAMRAYHASEINHTNHAITILLSITAAGGAVILSLLFADNQPNCISILIWGICFITIILSFAICLTTHLKLSYDHKTYTSFGKEYMVTSEILGFYSESDMSEYLYPIKKSKKIGRGKGYRKTQIIIWSFGGLLSLISLSIAIAFSILQPIHSPPNKSKAQDSSISSATP